MRVGSCVAAELDARVRRPRAVVRCEYVEVRGDRGGRTGSGLLGEQVEGARVRPKRHAEVARARCKCADGLPAPHLCDCVLSAAIGGGRAMAEQAAEVDDDRSDILAEVEDGRGGVGAWERARPRGHARLSGEGVARDRARARASDARAVALVANGSAPLAVGMDAEGLLVGEEAQGGFVRWEQACVEERRKESEGIGWRRKESERIGRNQVRLPA